MAAEPAIIHSDRLILRPMRPTELNTIAEAIASDAEASPWWGEDASKIRRWLLDPGVEVYVIEVRNTCAGVIMVEEENDPDYRSAHIDITLLGEYIGRGMGPEAITAIARHLVCVRGHHRLTIDPAVANERAIRAYEKVGFKRVGVLRRYERAPDGEWRDGLLMDLLAEEMDLSAPC